MADDGWTDMRRDEGDRWTVRGIDRALVRDVTAAARDERLTLGEWVSRALRTALERSKSEDAPEVGTDQIAPVLERLASLEATMATVEATVGLLDTYVRELRQDRERLGGLERGRTAVHPRPAPTPAAARPVPSEEN